MIRYTLAACDLGRVLLAATERGVCWLSFNDADAGALAALRAEFPTSDLHRDDAGLAPSVAALKNHLADNSQTLDLPLDVHATAFQQSVWDKLRQIPRGETRTYQQVAIAIGKPTAARAVARACATNPVSVVIPCHRVVGTDGELRGYRWGLWRKKSLLAA